MSEYRLGSSYAGLSAGRWTKKRAIARKSGIVSNFRSYRRGKVFGSITSGTTNRFGIGNRSVVWWSSSCCMRTLRFFEVNESIHSKSIGIITSCGKSMNGDGKPLKVRTTNAKGNYRLTGSNNYETKQDDLRRRQNSFCDKGYQQAYRKGVDSKLCGKDRETNRIQYREYRKTRN